jgi:hypothetical protein
VSVARERWADAGTRPLTAMTVLCLGVGFWMRARGFFYDVPALWLDECTWAMMLLELPLTELLIRPPGFMIVSKVMAVLFGPTEMPLRTMPWLASVGAMVMAPFLARRLFRADAARLLFVAVVALHPCATDFAKEFKPYSVSMALHMGLWLLTLRYLDAKTTKNFSWLLGVAVVGTLFAQDVIFSFPGIFPIVVAAGIILALLLAQYFFIWRNLPKDESDYWAEKYNVFYSKESGFTFVEWFTRRYEHIAAFPGYQRTYWRGSLIPTDERANVRDISHYVWIVIHVVGVVAMFWRKKYREATLLLLPLAVLFAFNQVGFWPFGVFRTNVFTVANTAAIAAMAFDEANPRRRPFGAIVPTTLLLVIPFFFFEDGWPPTKRALTRISEYPEVLEYLAERAPEPPAERQTLLLGRGNCDPWKYFLRYHPRTKPLRARLEAGFEVHCIETKEALMPTLNQLTTSPTRPTWLVRGLKEPQGRDPDLDRIDVWGAGLHVVSSYLRNPPDSPSGSSKGSSKRRRSSDADAPKPDADE